MLTRQLLLLSCAAASPDPLCAVQDVAESARTDDGHVIFRTHLPMSVYDALELARAAGGTLVTVDSAEKETWLLDNFGADEPYWIGLEYPRERWHAGAEIGFTHWARGEPNGYAWELFTAMNWSRDEPGSWGDTSGDVASDRWRALIEIPRSDLGALPTLPTRPTNRCALLLAVQGLLAKDLESKKYPNLRGLWERSVWTFDAGADGSGDPLASLGMLFWGVGSARSRLASSAPDRANQDDNDNLLTRLEAALPEVSTAALLDDPALTGILVDGRVDLRAANASPRKPGGSEVPSADALGRAAPLCIVATWTEPFTPGAEEPGETRRSRALAVIDLELGALLARLGARPGFAQEDWLIALSGLVPATIKKEKTEDDARRRSAVPLLFVHASLPPGEIFNEVLLADVAPTVLAHLGVEQRRGWQLDGRALVFDRPLAFGANLIQNGGAETQLGASEFGRFTPLTGWRIVAPFRVGRRVAGEPGPVDGLSLYQGVEPPLARIEQNIDLRPLEADIDRGDVHFRLSGWLGGRGGHQAPIECAVEFMNEQRKSLLHAAIGPVGPLERGQALGLVQGVAPDGLLPVEASGKVPRRARLVRVVLSAALPGRVGQAMADELALVLERSH